MSQVFQNRFRDSHKMNFREDISSAGVDKIAARYDTATPQGYRFHLINGDVTPPRTYASVEVEAKNAGFEFSLKANNDAEEAEQRSVQFIVASEHSDQLIMELAGRAIESAPDPEALVDHLLRLDRGKSYPVTFQSRFERFEDQGDTIVVSIWNVAVAPPKRVAYIHSESRRMVNRVEFADDANGREQSALYALQNPDDMSDLLSRLHFPPKGDSSSAV
jgi:hypothetical protein